MAATCPVCNKTALKLCMGCERQHYCNRRCQKKHWQCHRSVCKKKQITITACLPSGGSEVFEFGKGKCTVQEVIDQMVAWVASKNGVAEENITVDLALDTCKLDRRSTLAHYGIVEGNTQLTVVVSPDPAPVLVDSSNESDYPQQSSQASSASDSSEVSSTPDLPHFLLTFLV